MTRTLAALWRGFCQALAVGGQIVLAFMMVTICYDTVMRYAFAEPTTWSLEVNTFLIVYLATMTAAEVQRGNEHIRISFFADRLPWRWRQAASGLTALVGVVFCAILTWRGGLLSWQAYEYGERVSSNLGTPLVFPYSLLPIGFGALAIQFLLQALTALRGAFTRTEANHGG